MIALLEENSVTDKPYYEVVIGGSENKLTEIRKINADGNVFRESLDILSCEQYRYVEMLHYFYYLLYISAKARSLKGL